MTPSTKIDLLSMLIESNLITQEQAIAILTGTDEYFIKLLSNEQFDKELKELLK